MNLLISGISGRMGQMILSLAQRDAHWNTIEGVDETKSFETIRMDANVVIDFSHPTATKRVMDYCKTKKIPLVLGTTGLTNEEQELVDQASKIIPIMQATNMSLGMNIMFSLVEKVASILKGTVDIEVIEAHHNRKVDAPSGSAQTIVESIERGLGSKAKHVHGRQGQCPRDKGEIGIHAIRGGNIVGLHEANFINDLETIKITHEAYDRSVFAEGALVAAKFIIDKPVGIYNMKDVLNIQ